MLKKDFLLLSNMAFVWTEWVKVTTKNLKFQTLDQ